MKYDFSLQPDLVYARWFNPPNRLPTSMDFEDGELVTVLDINLRSGTAFCKSAKSGSGMCRTVPTDELAFINPDDYDIAGVFATEIQEPLMDVDTLRNMVIRQVNKCREEYVRNYGSPRFVKLPLWTYSALKQWSVIYNEVLEASSPERLIGLNVCPTNSIERIEDIEVF